LTRFVNFSIMTKRCCQNHSAKPLEAKRCVVMFYFSCHCSSWGAVCTILNVAGIPICFALVILTNSKSVPGSTIRSAGPKQVPKSLATVPAAH
jgi:hypothetical protein